MLDNPNMISAIISAIVALLVVFISQWLLIKRSSIELKTKKLEELYLILNRLSSQHVVRFERTIKISEGELDSTDNPDYIEKLYLLDINRDILMYVRLYFPKLEKIHKKLFHANREVNLIIHQYLSGEKVDESSMKLGKGDATLFLGGFRYSSLAQPH